jgi:hypothetical protein
MTGIIEGRYCVELSPRKDKDFERIEVGHR